MLALSCYVEYYRNPSMFSNQRRGENQQESLSLLLPSQSVSTKWVHHLCQLHNNKTSEVIEDKRQADNHENKAAQKVRKHSTLF